MSALLRSTALLVALFTLGACSETKLPPLFCPKIALLDGAGDLTRFNGRGQDLLDTNFTARIDQIPAECRNGQDNRVETEIQIVSRVSRGAALQGREVQFAYVVTVLKGDEVYDQVDVPATAVFSNGVERVATTSKPVLLRFPLPDNKSSTNYRVLVGFRMTPDELAFNRAHPTR